MVIFNTIASKAINDGIDALKDKRERESSKQAIVSVSGSIASGDSKTVSFKSADKNTALRGGHPFKSVDCYNATGQDLEIHINQVSDLVLPVPDGAQNGDSFENVGVSSIEIVNKGSSSANLSNAKITVSGNPSGVARGSK